jgi:3-isopropylmalate/(R)-2-methylmalate dehydratase small subunit
LKKRFRGRAWKFGDHVDTDCITPGKYENLPFEQLCTHCLEPLDPAFATGVAKDDLIVAGENFGCGSTREIAPRALKELKVGAVVAKSFARTFFRNAIAIGLPVLVSPDAVEKCRQGDILSIDISAAKIRNITADTAASADPIARELYLVLSNGGLFPASKKKPSRKSNAPAGHKGEA